MPSQALAYLRRRHIDHVTTSAQVTGYNESQGSADPEPRPARSVSAETAGERSPDALDRARPLEDPAEVADPLKPSIHPRKPRKFLKRLVWLLFHPQPRPRSPAPAAPVVEPPTPPAAARPAPRPSWARRLVARLFPGRRILTPEELMVERERIRRRELQAQLEKEAKLYEERLVTALNRLGLCYEIPKSERDAFTKTISVRFSCVRMYPEALYYFVDIQRLPKHVKALDLVQPGILVELSFACEKKVNGHYDPETGCVIIVERAGGSLGIPNHVKLLDLWNATPASADGLSIPFGMTKNSKPIYRSLSQMVSMLVAGTTGSGKSNFANVILCTLLRRNSPERLKLILVDLKGGMEFTPYEGVPHLYTIPDAAPGGICQYREHVPAILTWLLKEGERRIEVIKAAGYKDIGRFNARNRKKALPHMVLMIDEWADVWLLPTKIAKGCETLLTDIASRFRAVGLHVIICTQTPKAEVISTRIKAVLPAKVCFSMASNTASMLILDNNNANGLSPRGRMILQFPPEEIQVQAPFISDEDIAAIVAGAKSGNYDKVQARSHDISELEIMTWALANDTGYLAVSRLFKHFQSRGITQREIFELVASWEGKEFVIGTSLYRVEPGAGSRARRLVAVDNCEEEKSSPT